MNGGVALLMTLGSLNDTPTMSLDVLMRSENGDSNRVFDGHEMTRKRDSREPTSLNFQQGPLVCSKLALLAEC